MNQERTQRAPDVHVVDMWTGRHAVALRQALRMTNEEFATHLGTALRTVTKWNQDLDTVPTTEIQRALDTALTQASPEEQTRFENLYGKATANPESQVLTPDQPVQSPVSLSHSASLIEHLHWLDKAAKNPLGTSEFKIEQVLTEQKTLLDSPQSVPSTSELISALSQYYQSFPDGYHSFTITLESTRLNTGILVRNEWTNLALELGRGKDTFELGPPSILPPLNSLQEHAALERLARALHQKTQLTNAPLYDLSSLFVKDGKMRGVLDTTDFLSYALTLDLLEHELAAQVRERGASNLRLPLRDQYLPTAQTITSLDSRLCAGGVAAMFAAKRSRAKRQDEDDYAILVQERSSAVINAVGRLAVIPKGCHQPLSDYSDDAQISSTLERELEEELFSRDDLDGISGTNRYADPLHLSRLSKPLRWLMTHDDAWSMECTGIGLNMINGNFEIACLIAIHDPAWWDEFGGMIESNWESSNLQRYSSRNATNLAKLLATPNWGNEDIFAMTLGLQRLAELSPQNVHLPPIQRG